MAAKTEAWTYFRAKDDGFTMTLERMEKKTENFANKSKKKVDSLSVSFKNLRSQISTLSGSLGNMPLIGGLGAAGIFATGKTAVEKFANRESQETSIKFLSKTEEEGKYNLAFLRKLSNDYGVAFGGMLDGYKQLKANMNMMDIAPEEQNQKFKKISAAIRVMGLNAEQSGSVFYAFSQMMSKGQIQAQELKLQLANVFPAAVPLLAKSMGKNVGELNKMLDAGAISWKKYGDNFINYMYDNIKSGIPNAVTTVSAGLARISNTFENAWVGFGDAIAKSGVLDMISEMGAELGNWIGANKEMISSTIKGGVDWVKGAFQWGVEHKDEIGSLLKGIVIFIAAIKTANLLMMFTNPITLAAAGMAAIVVSINAAIDGINKAKETEKNKKNPNSRTTAFSASESFISGGRNLLYGAWNTTPLSGEYKKGAGQLMTGTNQVVLGLLQSVLETSALASNKFDPSKDRGYAGQMADRLGRNAMEQEKWLNPQDFRPEMAAPTADNFILNRQYSKESVTRDPQMQPSISEMMKMFADAMSNMTQNVTVNRDNVAIDYSYGSAIKPQ